MCAKPSVTLSDFSTGGGLTRPHLRFTSELYLSHSVVCVISFLLTKTNRYPSVSMTNFGDLLTTLT
jgi:hypothetical protein